MRKILKSLSVIIMAFIIVINIGTIAFAVEDDCSIQFILKDETEGKFNEDVEVTLLNADTKVSYDYKITKDEYGNDLSVRGMIEQGSNYSIAIRYKSKDKGNYKICDINDDVIDRVDAKKKEIIFKWKIVDKNKSSDSKDDEKAIADAINNATEGSNDTSTSEIADNTIATNNKEADDVYNTYLNIASKMEDNKKFSYLFSYYKSNENTYAERYVKYCNGDAEEYKKLSPFKQFLLYALYIDPCMFINAKNYNSYFSSIEKWNANVIGLQYSLLERCDKDQAEAFKTIMEWQYNYFKANGAMYNFITGEDSLSILTKDGKENNNGDKETIDKIKDEIEESNEEKGVWSNFIQGVKDNIVIIIILGILIIATIVVVIYRKKKNVEDK